MSHFGRLSSKQRLWLGGTIMAMIALVAAAIVFVLVRVGTQAGFMIVPFVAVAVLGIVQAVRGSGFIGRRRLRGRVTDSADLGRKRADEILAQGD